MKLLFILILGAAALLGCERETSTSQVSSEQLYQRNCQACHGERGQGRDNLFPPLVGSDWLAMPDPALALLLLKGLRGPIIVDSKVYNGLMPSMANLNDRELAEVLSYARREFHTANAADIDVELVASMRELSNQRSKPWQSLEQLLTRCAELLENDQRYGECQ